MIRDIKIVTLTFLCVFMLSGGCLFSAEAAEVFETAYVCCDSKGDIRWKADTEIKKVRGNVYLMTEKAAGYYSGFTGKVAWAAELEFEKTEETVRPLRMERRVTDPAGNILSIDKQQFNFDDNTVICTHEDPSGETSSEKKYKFKKDVVNRLILGLYVQQFLDEGKTRQEVQMVTEEPGFYNIEVKVLDKENIAVNGRERSAFKLCLDPQLGLLGFVKIFLPKAYVWHSAEPKFEWFRYKGLEGSINSPKVEITTLEQ